MFTSDERLEEILSKVMIERSLKLNKYYSYSSNLSYNDYEQYKANIDPEYKPDIDSSMVSLGELKIIICTEDSCLYYDKCKGEKCGEYSCIIKVIENYVRKKSGYEGL